MLPDPVLLTVFQVRQDMPGQKGTVEGQVDRFLLEVFCPGYAMKYFGECNGFFIEPHTGAYKAHFPDLVSRFIDVIFYVGEPPDKMTLTDKRSTIHNDKDIVGKRGYFAIVHMIVSSGVD